MKYNISINKEAKGNLKYVFISMILLLLIGVAVAHIGMSELEYGEQTTPLSYNNRINIINKNNIINDFNLEKVSDIYSEIESGELNPDELVFLDEFGNEIEIENIKEKQYGGDIYDVDVEKDVVLVARSETICGDEELAREVLADNILGINDINKLNNKYGEGWWIEEGKVCRKESLIVWSGNSNNGTAVDGAHQVDAGYLGKGFEFDGAGDYISTSITPSNFTLSVWVNPNVLTGDRRIWSAGDAKAELLIYANNYNFYGGGYDMYPVGAAATIGKWDNVVCVVEQGVIAILYFNGVQIVNDTSVSVTALDKLVIGMKSGGPNYFNGTIDEVIIFNRSLSAAEIQALYANTSQTYLERNFTGLAETSHTFKAYTQDYAGNLNETAERTVTVDLTYPQINFTMPPTPANGTATSNTSIEINVSITEADLDEVKFNWDGTNYTIFNDSVVLMMNFDNRSALGECYDNETEILTESGWKLFRDLEEGERVATLNAETGEVEWQAPTAQQEFDYKGPMYKILLRDGSELLVSEKHKVYVKIRKILGFLGRKFFLPLGLNLIVGGV